IRRGGDFVQVSPGGHALWPFLGDVRPRLSRVIVLFLQHPRPRILFLPVLLAQGPKARELFAVKSEAKDAGPVVAMGIADRLPSSAIPQEHRSAAVLSFGDDA